MKLKSLDKKKVYIIAEIGVNHNSDIKKAKKLIKVSKKVGADCVKFQAFKASEITTKNCGLALYQKKRIGFKSQYEMLKKYELKELQFKHLFQYAKKVKIDFLLSVFDETSYYLDKKLNTKFIKIPSGEITNYPLLNLCAKSKKRVILSTGASKIEEVANALKVLKKKNTVLLHCNSAYPSPIKDTNINNLYTLKKKFKKDVGLSDHSKSTLIPAISVGAGSTFIEKHITLSNKMSGPDHSASLNPYNFNKMVKNIRLAEKSMGSFKKKPSQSEKKNLKIIRKYIVAKKFISKGQKFSEKNICVKRSNGGISAIHWRKILGKKASKNFKSDEKI